MAIYRKFLLVLTILAIGLSGCRLNEEKSWDVDLLVPIATAELSMSNMLRDSIVVQNSDNSLTYVQRLSLTALSLGDVLQVPDEEFQKTVSLKTLQLGQRKLQRDITLADVARNAGFAGTLILMNHGNKMAVPPLDNLASGETDIDANSFFENATFIEGKLRLQLRNGFPVELTNISFQLKNKSDKSLVITDNIASIPAGGEFSKIYPLDGLTLEGNLIAEITDMSSPGSKGQEVLIDTTDALSITITAYDMQVYSARAIFPAQNMVDDKQNIPYELDDAEIVFMKVKSGDIKFTTVHTMPEELKMNYTIPGAKLNGVPLVMNRIIPAAPPGSATTRDEVFSIAGYDVDLTGQNKDTVNTFFNTLTVGIDSTGKLQNFSLADSIYLFYGLFDVVPRYARGYLGKKQLSVKETSPADMFNQFIDGTVSLEDVNFNLNLSNGVGAPAEMVINKITARNTRTNQSMQLISTLLTGTIAVPSATDNPYKEGIVNLPLNNSNSNIKELISIMPDVFEYDVEVKLNPTGIKSYNQFIYDYSRVSAEITVEIPLHLGLNGLTLQDTVELQPNNNAAQAGIQNGRLIITAENTFPFSAEVQVYFLDAAGNITDSLFIDENLVKAGTISNITNRVEQPVITRTMLDLNEKNWQYIQNGGKAIIRTRLNTPQGQKVKIYSNYRLKVSVAADVRYRSTI